MPAYIRLARPSVIIWLARHGERLSEPPPDDTNVTPNDDAYFVQLVSHGPHQEATICHNTQLLQNLKQKEHLPKIKTTWWLVPRQDLLEVSNLGAYIGI